MINPGLEHGATIHVIGEHTQGVHAELAAIPATNVVPLRDGVSFEDAAAFPLVYETAYRMLVTRARLQAGEWVLVWGIGGGVATAAFRIAQALGARTIVTSSSDDKLAKAKALGADVTLNHDSDDVVAAVKEAAGGGADVIVETVGDATWKRSLDAARPGGRITVCGATTGPNPPAALHRVWWKQLDILGSTMGTRADFEGAYDLVAAGATPVIDTVFPLAEARAAHERLEAASSSGRSSSIGSDRGSDPTGSQRRAWDVPGDLAEAEDELGVVGHPLGRPGRVPGQLDLDVLHAGELRDHAVDVLLDHRAGRAAHRGQAVDHLHLRAFDLDVVEQPELDDVHPELRILDLVQRLEDFFLGDHCTRV